MRNISSKIALNLKRKILCGEFNYLQHITDLKDLCIQSYDDFIQKDTPAPLRKRKGIHKILSNFFPMYHSKSKMKIEYISYSISPPRIDIDECALRGINYSGSMRVHLKVTNLNTNKSREIKSSLGEIPLITPNGTFIINGHEKIFISQIQKSPGVLFTKEVDSTTNKKVSMVKIYPSVGSWLHLKIERELISITIDKKKKFGITSFLLCFPKNYHSGDYDSGYDISEILNELYVTEEVEIINNMVHINFNKNKNAHTPLSHSIYIDGKCLAKRGEMLMKDVFNLIVEEKVAFPVEELCNLFLGEDIWNNETGEIYFEIGEKVSKSKLQELIKIGKFKLFKINDDYRPFILNTLHHEGVTTRDDALSVWANSIKLGNHYGAIGLSKIFITRFSDIKYYDLDGVGRRRLNKILNLNKEENYVTIDDLLATIKRLILLNDDIVKEDEIDSLINKRYIGVGDILETYFRNGIIKFEKNVRDRIYNIDISDEETKEDDSDDNKKITADIFNMRIILYPLLDGFYRSAQMLSQINILSAKTSHGKITSIVPGGNKDKVLGSLRDTNTSKFGRICPVQTPDGKKIGLVEHLTIFSRIDEDGFITTPYYEVKNGIVHTDSVVYVSSFDETSKVVSSLPYYKKVKEGNKILYKPISEYVAGKKDQETGYYHHLDVNYVVISENQILSFSTCFIPFIANTDGYRVLTAANMNTQAVPLIEAESCYIGTGVEGVFSDKILAKRAGKIKHVDYGRIVVELEEDNDEIVDVYYLKAHQKTNDDTCITHKAIVDIGDIVKEGQILADGFTTTDGEFAPGKNLLVCYMSHPYCHEDAFVLSDRLVEEETLSSIHMQQHICNVFDTRNGPEKNTRDIPKVHDDGLNGLNEDGTRPIGAWVRGGQILVGKVTPSGADVSVSAENKLLNIILGDKPFEFEDSSLRLPYGSDGTVIKVQQLHRKGLQKDGSKILQDKITMDEILKEYSEKINIIKSAIYDKASKLLKKELTESELFKYSKDEVFSFCDKKNHKSLELIFNKYNKALESIDHEKQKKLSVLKHGYDLPDGVLKIIIVTMASKKTIEVGDKLAGRYGNKGVISSILPVAEMPHLEDGTPVDMIINPLGLLARMNLGQVLETTIGYAIFEMKRKLKSLLIDYDNDFRDKDTIIEEMKGCLKTIVQDESILKNIYDNSLNIESLKDNEVIQLVRYFEKNGIRVQNAQFSTLSKEDLDKIMEDFFAEKEGKVDLYDGRIGEKFEDKVLVGYQMIMKLYHLVSLKLHARSVGPYSLVNLQPLGGKARFGGQRCGEMEVWALQASGAAFNCVEILSVKSDDPKARNNAFSHLIKLSKYSILVINPGNSQNVSESFKLLMYELISAGFEISIVEK
jgi:DNA-directed RNA polymerase subunit beta